MFKIKFTKYSDNLKEGDFILIKDRISEGYASFRITSIYYSEQQRTYRVNGICRDSGKTRYKDGVEMHLFRLEDADQYIKSGLLKILK